MPGHVARRARMDDGGLTTSSLSHTTPRSFSWTRSTRPPNITSMNKRFARSQSVTRARSSTEDDEEKKEMAEAAYREWLKRKAAEPHTPRASPTREQICLHLKEDARHRVYNNWFHSRRFNSSPKSNGETTPTSETVLKTLF